MLYFASLFTTDRKVRVLSQWHSTSVRGKWEFYLDTHADCQLPAAIGYAIKMWCPFIASTMGMVQQGCLHAAFLGYDFAILLCLPGLDLPYRHLDLVLQWEYLLGIISIPLLGMFPWTPLVDTGLQIQPSKREYREQRSSEKVSVFPLNTKYSVKNNMSMW